MLLYNPPIFNHIVASSGEKVKCKILNTGTWNMDVVSNRSVGHGLTVANIIAFSCIIIADDELHWYEITYSDVAGSEQGQIWADNNVIYAYRKTGGFFDSIDFDRADLPRGRMKVWYIE